MATIYSRYRILVGIVLCILSQTTALAQQGGLKPGDGMVSREMVLFDAVRETSVALDAVLGEGGTVIIFWSNQCPWTARYRDRLQELMVKSEGATIQFVFVNSNNEAAFPKERVTSSRAERDAKPLGVYLRDDGAGLARAFGAERTPQVFVFDRNATLIYKGAIDDSPGDPAEVQAHYLADAVEALGRGQNAPLSETKPFGCQIKY